jgi:peptidoglycan/xylan/chitin deacetylase (PgdA/CDA1 family)
VLAGVASSARAAIPPSLVGGEWSRLPTASKVVALTFDCGGNAAGVSSILSTLRKTGATGTFFMTGRFVEAFPTRARVIAARYPVGNHTYSHPHLTSLSAAAVVEEVRRAGAVIRRIVRKDPRPLFRFPYGDRDARTIGLVNSLGYGVIGWTVDTLGWEGRSAGQTPTSVVRRVREALRPGAIVLMHAGAAPDGSMLDADALPALVVAIRKRGYDLVAVRPFVFRRTRRDRPAG